jgi:KUP system potassium uptake protein
MRIIHTSIHAKGQIYMPTVNWALMIACLTLVLVFQESSRLASAYGIAVTATMAITSFMYFKITRIKWNWPLWKSASLLMLFLFFDCSFLGANLLKVVDGGWITISIALIIATSMITWRDGRALLAKLYSSMRMPADVFLKDIEGLSLPRISGTAVFMSITPEGIPHILLHLLKHNEALHERVLLLSILSEEIPTVDEIDRVTLEDLGYGFFRIKAHYGFMETPNITKILDILSKKGITVDIYSTSFFLGRETLLATGTNLMAQWRKFLFIFMSRNAWNATSFFGLPPERVIELGIQVQL